MALSIRNLVKRINKAAPAYGIGALQQLRAQLRGKRLATNRLFSDRTVFPPWYAFHHGGRTELQFNVGVEDLGDGKWWRHGVAFSFQPGQSLPDPVAVLGPKVDWFNEWLRISGNKLLRFKMWHFDGEDNAKPYRPREIPRDLVRSGVFVFLGSRVREADVEVDRILRDFDALFPLYEYVETMARGDSNLPTFLPKKRIRPCRRMEHHMTRNLATNDASSNVRFASDAVSSSSATPCASDTGTAVQ